jgi:hypothetical protein
LSNVVQSLWIGPRLSFMERLCIQSFLGHGHEFQLYVYDQIDGVPARTKLRDGNEIVPSSRIFYYRKHNSCAGFSNMFRYKLLLERGGWWVDMDTVCLSAFGFSEPYVFSSEIAAAGPNKEAGSCANTGAIRAPAGSELMRYCWDYCDRADNSALMWGETGPKLFGHAIKNYALNEYIQPPHVFCPVPFDQWNRVLAPGLEWDFCSETRAIHLWNEMWRRNNCPKDGSYDPTCLYERLKLCYLHETENDVG